MIKKTTNDKLTNKDDKQMMNQLTNDKQANK